MATAYSRPEAGGAIPLYSRTAQWMGAVSCLLGLAVVAGWLAGNLPVIQLRSDLTPMAFNSALLLVLGGVALITVARRQLLWVRLLAGIGLLLSAVTMSQYFTGIDLDIDQLLMDPHLEGLQMARRFFTPQRPWLDAMLDLTRHINTEFAYDPEATQIDTPLSEVFATKRGVCQDFAHLMLSCLRSLELPARYVSGYILNEPPPGEEKLVGGDASHAWVEAWLPEAGWIGFDPTNGKLANAEFITIGWGRDYNDIAPLRGIVLGGG